MPRDYKLRLGDGTVLAVDEQGLGAWVLDAKAMAQAAGSRDWRPLKEVLAETAAAAPRAASAPGRGPRPGDPVATIALKPLDDAGGTGVRLAHEDEQVWEGEELYEGGSAGGVFGLVWLWAKRLVLIAGLVAAAVVAVNTWPTWLPVVTQVGLAIFTKVDEYARPARAPAAGPEVDERRRMQEALQQAAGQLPHLSAETIQLVMSSSVWSVPDPPEVFSRAYAAAQRGAPALAPREAEELKALQAALLAGLRPPERQRVRAYDRVRQERATLPAEDREVLGLFARGARALPPQSRERLQALLGRAVAAGLASGGA
jgi:hypothetical protein